MFDILSNSLEAFTDLSYDKLAETHGQWPIVGRSDLYYGGTTYENTQGWAYNSSRPLRLVEQYAYPRSGKKRLFVQKKMNVWLFLLPNCTITV
ncbi:hypothetical protein [Candidatus Villigracilis affinis]|uniref:hypothetical protein n=1 Tax=Candidatus Villigracilis affinis TaxID=3140682 RepID=UPI002A1DEF3E|nr:hypothetical protein [Anaerolineales bacterium]